MRGPPKIILGHALTTQRQKSFVSHSTKDKMVTSFPFQSCADSIFKQVCVYIQVKLRVKTLSHLDKLLNLSCFDLMCLDRLPLSVALYSHCPQGYLTPSCLDLMGFLCSLIITLMTRIFDTYMFGFDMF